MKFFDSLYETNLENSNTIIYEGVEVQKKTVFNDAIKIARWLKNKGIAIGDQVAVLDFNNPSLISILLACIKIGATPIFVNWRMSKEEFCNWCTIAAPEIILYSTFFNELVQDSNYDQTKFISIDTCKSENENLLEEEYTHPFQKDEVVAVVYTSGTTGNPKKVAITYGNITFMVTFLNGALPQLDLDARYLLTAPLFSIAGIGFLLMSLMKSLTLIIIPFFDPKKTLECIQKYQVTHLFLAPAMIQLLLQEYTKSPCYINSLKNIHYGGSPISLQTLTLAKKIFNCDLTQGYGLTETTGLITFLDEKENDQIIENQQQEIPTGKPLEGIKVKLWNTDSEGNGEVITAGPHVSLQNEEGTLPIIEMEGEKWLKTGDIGYLNEGLLYIKDRVDDMIVSMGMNIYPAEVEKVLEQFPGVMQVVVFDIPDEKYGSMVCASIVVSDAFNEEKLKIWSKDKLAGYKFPKKFFIESELPRNTSGKVLKRVIRNTHKVT